MAAGRVSEAENEEGGGSLFASCSFEDLGLHPTLCAHLRDKMGFSAPTQIQAQAIPVAISGQHLLVKAATGTGKTLVYLAPIVHLMQQHMPRIERSDGAYALVLVPTRELCMQVYGIAQKLVHRFHWLVPGYIMGGENRAKEKARLRKGISILIATPGRLLDHLKNTSSFIHSKLRWIVFDEADRILELGFGKDLEEILDLIGSRTANSGQEKYGTADRQNLLLSATLNDKVNQLANISLVNPVMIGLNDISKLPLQLTSLSNKVSLASEDEGLKKHGGQSSQSVESYQLPDQLLQRYVKVPCGCRLVVLLSILKTLSERGSNKVVVFLSTCDSVDFHYKLLDQFELYSNMSEDTEQKQKFIRCKVFRLHGDMDHADRMTTFKGFSSEKSAIMVCTDVAARGLDIPKVKCIIQYDSPGEASEYVHRVGRTARLGDKGEALLFLQPIEVDYLHDLEKHGVSLKEYPLQKALDYFPVHDKKFRGKKILSLDVHPWVMFLQRAVEGFVSGKEEMKRLGKDGFLSWVRAYAAHRGELKMIFMVKKLHLGHVAKSFGLREQPSLVGGSHVLQQAKDKKRKKRDPRYQRPAKRSRRSVK